MVDRRDGLTGLMIILTPTLLGVIGVLLLNLPLRLFDGSVPTPIFPLAVIFFWTLYGTNYLPSYATFGIGLLQDLISGGPLGVWPSVYLAVQLLIITQKTYFVGREQHVVWFGFMFATSAACSLLWIEMSLLNRAWVPVGPLFFQMFTTVLMFPVLSIFFSNLHERVIVD